MKRSFLFFTLLMLTGGYCFGQAGEAPNYSNSALLPPSAAQASKMNSTPVNLFTGVPAVSVPIHSFSSNSGVAMSISVDYAGGGIRANESPSIVGLGWYLNAGGIISRTVRGMPDDIPTYGYLYASAIPADWRSDGNKYYHDSIDTQQDIFQFNFPGGSGRFFIGKNGQIIVAPLSKIKVIANYQTYQPLIDLYQKLKSFRIVTENGVKYDFEEVDYTSFSYDNSYFGSGYTYTPSGYIGKSFGVAWYLNRIISPFYTDTIKLNYQSVPGGDYTYKLPQTTFVNNANGTRKTPTDAPGYGNAASRKISSIDFPDKTKVSFIYSYDLTYSGNDYALTKIKVSDTAFRFGYLLQYDSLEAYWPPGHTGQPSYRKIKLLLKSVTPYTKYETQTGYRFAYNQPLFAKVGAPGDTLQNKVDYWGFYNGAVNGDNRIPKVNGYTWGANRLPNGNAIAGSLSTFFLPSGGSIAYSYELNDHYPYTKQSNTVSISNPSTSTQNNITVTQVFNNKHQLVFLLDKSVARTGSAPISGSGNLNLNIKSTDGATTYLTSSISLYDLFYYGQRLWTFNLNNGTYRLETSLSSGTTITGSFPLSVNWENKSANTSRNYDTAGGIRVKWVMKQNASNNSDGILEEIKYVQEDGKSSGFLGDIPKYDYPYREIITNTSTTIDYTAVSSEPVAPMDFAQGSPVGYNRVELVRKSFFGKNLGKEVQEFTDLKDVNGNPFTPSFPYSPQEQRGWGLGMPKRFSMYDSSGTLVKRTVNTYGYDTTIYNNDNFKGLKLGHSQTTYSSDPNYPPVTKTKGFIGQEYYLANGRAYLTYSADTLYQLNGSMNTSWQQIDYDTNYNATKVTASYDRSRNLVTEQRIYYPYNYTVGGGVGKLRDSTILSQMIATETWITGDGNPRIKSGVVTSYRQIGNGDIKPDTIYTFESNKPIAQATITTFNPAVLNRNTTYFKPQSFFTSYDTKGNMNEMKDLVSGRSSSIILDYDQEYPVAKASNTKQADIAYTSFEAAGTGNWTVAGSQRDTACITGKKGYNLSNGNITRTGLTTSTAYLLTVWAKSGASVSVNGSSLSTSIATQNNWSLYSVPLTGISSVTVSGSGVIDELRLHPKDANMATSTYEPLIGVISGADANNTIAYNEYDRLNRLKIVRDKDKNIVQRFDFSDTIMNISTAPVWVGFDNRCSPTVPGQMDTLYKDMNIYSDSSGYSKWVSLGRLNCSCDAVSGNPQYAVINGNCEMGTWGAVSSVRIKVNGVFMWQCRYRYCFSNGSYSSYYEDLTFYSSCFLSCN